MRHRVGANGQVVIPKFLRDRLGLGPGVAVIFEEHATGVLVKSEPGIALLPGRLHPKP